MTRNHNRICDAAPVTDVGLQAVLEGVGAAGIEPATAGL
jgi:hypothetical protein